ncbi:MAG TPA: alpha/beta hydrolase-fold protein, partial [Longimicrobiales bacterium]|nr:alpha/beta hydrolase-fold protein [Longimicrobiales bacterium]
MLRPIWISTVTLVLAWPADPSCAQVSANAAAVPAGTERHTIQSTVLGEPRIFDVTLPPGYARDTTARYPLVVTLDGEFEGEVAAAIARFYAAMGSLPGVIVVAVHNTARTRDLTPAAVPPFNPPPGGSGGADRFLSFLESELIPTIERAYRVAPMRVLIGHSLGGLFALHALSTRPALFTGYLIMEPAAWWNEQKHVQDARAALRTPAARRARVMLVNAQSLSDDTVSWGGNKPMIRHVRVTDETHASMAAIGIAAGLRRIFEDFRPPQWRPGRSPIEMLARYDSLADRIGYRIPVPEETFATVVRMCLDSRIFEDAQQALERMERSFGTTERSRGLRTRLETERAQPAPQGFIPLVIPARRPTPAKAARFIGRWESQDRPNKHVIDIRPSGDTIVVRDRITYPDTEPFDALDQVIQLTDDGVLEWGLPFFRGIAALLVLEATLVDDTTMVVRREPRGWLPRDPNFSSGDPVTYKRT